MLMRLTRGSTIPVCAAAGLLAVAAAQSPSKIQLTARELFYAAAQTAKQAQPARKQGPPPTRNGPPPATGPALGLRYNILRLTGGAMTEVPPDTVFHAGDRIGFSVQTNSPGHLYIVSQGTSGKWKPMFPSPELDDGSNRVEAWKTYDMPPGARMLFDQQTGTEKIFIVFSREPEPDLEKLMYRLRSTRPPSTPEPASKPKELVSFASLDINDTTVGRLRSVYSRDLIIEKVTLQTPGERKETAVYVVNPTGSSKSCLVADLSLVHQ
jgi:hypothetical protein